MQTSLRGVSLRDLALASELTAIRCDCVDYRGDESDGYVSAIALDERDRPFEVGYYFGEDKSRRGKNVLSISPQIGCPAKCPQCELSRLSFTRSLSPQEMYEQVLLMLRWALRVGVDIDAIAHKVSIAKSGDGLFNRDLVAGLEEIAQLGFSFKMSTLFPEAPSCWQTFEDLCTFANCMGDAQPVQLTVSLLSTDEDFRLNTSLPVKVLDFAGLQEAFRMWRRVNPKGRKPNLSLIVADGIPIDVRQIREMFPPEEVNVRLRMYVESESGSEAGLGTVSVDEIEAIGKSFWDAGYLTNNWGTPTATELRFRHASNNMLLQYLKLTGS